MQQAGGTRRVIAYGWPICWADRRDRPDDQRAAVAHGTGVVPGPAVDVADDAARVLRPDRAGEPACGLWRAYAVPKAIRPCDGTLLAPRYRGNAFVALRGSWNRGHPTGHLVLRISFDERGQPQAFDELLTGFIDGDGSHFYGRSLGIAIDGALLRPVVALCDIGLPNNERVRGRAPHPV